MTAEEELKEMKRVWHIYCESANVTPEEIRFNPYIIDLIANLVIERLNTKVAE